MTNEAKAKNLLREICKCVMDSGNDIGGVKKGFEGMAWVFETLGYTSHPVLPREVSEWASALGSDRR